MFNLLLQHQFIVIPIVYAVSMCREIQKQETERKRHKGNTETWKLKDYRRQYKESGIGVGRRKNTRYGFKAGILLYLYIELICEDILLKSSMYFITLNS